MAVWNGAGFWQLGGCRRVTTATPECLGWVERPMEAATRDAASVCFASASRAGGADRIQRNRRADAVACWWRIGSTGRSRIAQMESRYQSESKAAGGTCGNAHRYADGDATDLCVAVPRCSSRMACDCSSRQISMHQRAPVGVESSVSSGRDRSAIVAPSLAQDGQQPSFASTPESGRRKPSVSQQEVFKAPRAKAPLPSAHTVNARMPNSGRPVARAVVFCTPCPAARCHRRR